MKKFKVHWEELVVEAHWGTIEADTKKEAEELIQENNLCEVVEEEGHEFLYTEDQMNLEVVDPDNMI